jgi:hypothetical protein
MVMAIFIGQGGEYLEVVINLLIRGAIFLSVTLISIFILLIILGQSYW